jgi:hypothetical protein
MGPDLMPLSIEPGDLALMQALEAADPGTALASLELDQEPAERLERARRLIRQGVLLPRHPLLGTRP